MHIITTYIQSITVKIKIQIQITIQITMLPIIQGQKVTKKEN